MPYEPPIPGANFTSDTRNYPWHRPPEYTDLDKAILYIGKRITEKDKAPGLLTMMESGIPITQLTQLFLMSGIGAGKWTLDFALLLAGPTAHMLVLLAKGYGIKYNLGLDDSYPSVPTKALFDTISTINNAKAKAAGRGVLDSINDIQEETTRMIRDGTLRTSPKSPAPSGFMSSPNPNEQQSMLGQSPEGESPIDLGGI